MPRGPRLDQRGALHHVIARGLERREIFYDDSDREDFLRRVCRLALEGSLTVYAWALMPNHVHLLVRTAGRSLGSCMRSLLGGYATAYNLRHARVGHLFQNRYKSILCEEEPYFLTLVSYIHLNPVRAGVVGNLAELDNYPWTGHSSVMDHHPRSWQDVDEVLRLFGTSRKQAQRAYRKLLVHHLGSDQPVDLDGGGLRRSIGGLETVEVLARGREAFRSDERILGRSAFTEGILRELNGDHAGTNEALDFERLVAAVSTTLGVPPSVLTASGRSRLQARAREALAFLWISGLGRSGLSLARRIGVTSSAIYVAAGRGSRDRDRWLEVLAATHGTQVG